MLKQVSIAMAAGSGLLAIAAAAQQTNTQTIGAARSEVARPADLTVQVPQDSILLKERNTTELLQRVPVQRRLNVQAVRAQPVIQLNQGTADMAPVLQNRDAPVNVAERLRARPQLATVSADSFEVAEIPQGIVVRQFLAYSLKSNVCSNPSQRSALAQQGVECFTRSTLVERTGAVTGGSTTARFVGDQGQRRRALAEATQVEAQQRAQIDADIAQLRSYLANPAQRAQIAAQVGEQEANRLAGLSDDALEEAIINTADIEVEEVMFVPNLEAQDLQIKARPTFGKLAQTQAGEFELSRISIQRDAEDAQMPPAPSGPQSLRPVPGPITGATDLRGPQQLDISQNIAIDRETFLTGFTLGRTYEWRRRVSVTIAWCLLGCKRTYYIEPYAGLSYGFGLRFPVRMQGTYQYRHQNGVERAAFVPQFAPFNGGAADYQQSGLSNSQLYGGQELVAEAEVYAGLLFKLPAGHQGSLSIPDIGLDLTDRLPAPFQNGHFSPPAPGQTTPPVIRTFDTIDLLMNRGNFGVVGARVHPAVKFELFSNGLSFVLRDHVAGSQQVMNASGQAYPLSVNDSHYSRFTVSDPVYNLGFQMTPGLVGRLFVDIAVWSNHWDWPVWFPQLTVKLPPSGANFTCHAGTQCGHQYKLRADHWRPAPRASTSTRPGSGAPPARANPPRADIPPPPRADIPPPRATTPPPPRANPGN